MGVTRRISTELTLDGEKAFKDQMSSVNRELETLKTEMKLSEATFKGQANTVEALTDKDRILREEIEHISFGTSSSRTRVEAAKFMNDAGIIGAAALGR